jgi:hypothetical protein
MSPVSVTDGGVPGPLSPNPSCTRSRGSWPRSAFGSMSHHPGWMRDCRTAVGYRPIFLAP